MYYQKYKSATQLKIHMGYNDGLKKLPAIPRYVISCLLKRVCAYPNASKSPTLAGLDKVC
jgi:hypothetical protein